jgi:hypothetical protein
MVNFDTNTSTDPEACSMGFNLNCIGCGKKFSVGKDSIINSGVVPADGAIQPMVNPDIIKIEQWSNMHESARETQRRLYGGIIASNMLSKMSGGDWSRIWRCPSCQRVNNWKDMFSQIGN